MTGSPGNEPLFMDDICRSQTTKKENSQLYFGLNCMPFLAAIYYSWTRSTCPVTTPSILLR